MGRHFIASIIASTCLLVSHVSWANDLLNLELTAGVGASAYNLATDSALAPPYVQFQASYLPIHVGPVSMGPLLGVPVGFYSAEREVETTADDGTTSTQLEDHTFTQIGIRAGWQVYGRPNIHLAWNVTAAVDFVLSPLGEDDDPLDFVWGLDVAGAIAFYLTAGFGLTAGLGYSFFYGVDASHVISGQLGLLISYEVIR